MNNRRNYYRILHVQEDAPEEIIRTSYRTLMQRMKMHPDLGGDHWDATLINEAYATLIDPERRADYDRQLPASVETRRDGPEPVDRPPTFESSCSQYPEGDSTSDDDDRCPLCGTPHAYGESIPASARCAHCNGSLYPAVKRRFDDAGRRAISRTPKNIAVACTVYGTFAVEQLQVVSDDISPNGIRLRTAHAIPAGARMKIECELLSAIGVVRHCRRAPGDPARMWRVGVEFLTLRLAGSRGAFVSDTV
ncbi:MAG: DnaJ domain-containing protein [Gammaproteobacteria bacterium]